MTLIDKPMCSKSSSWLYTLHVDNRDFFSDWMLEQGITASRVHERNDKQKAFKKSLCYLPGVDAFNGTQVSIPVGWWITDDDRRFIVSKIKEFSSLMFKVSSK